MRYLVLLGTFMWTAAASLSPGTASAAPLTEILAAQSFTTSDGLAFSNFQATLTYGQGSPGLVEGLVTTRQASLADLQLTSLPNGFQLTGFQWEGSATRSSRGFPTLDTFPLAMNLRLDYTVTGLGGENGNADFGARVSVGAFASLGFPIHSLLATTSTGEEANPISCPAAACRFPVAFLPLGTTQATVSDNVSFHPQQACANFSDLTSCRFAIPSGATSVTFFQAASAIPEPATWLLMATGLSGLAALSRRKLQCRPSGL